MTKIKSVCAREVIDSRGNPTIEAEVFLDSGFMGRAIVPSGASTGEHEALELRDGDKKRYLGKGVLKAVQNAEGPLSDAVIGMDADKIEAIDQRMIELDGTPTKSELGANAILAISLATAWASANSQSKPLYQWVAEHCPFKATPSLPIPMMNVINGGSHADNSVDFQEFMLVPRVGDTFSRTLQAGVEVFHNLKKILKDKKMVTAVGDEGGFAPDLSSNREALDILMEAIKAAGYTPGKDINLALDVASSEFFDKKGTYLLENEKNPKYSSKQLMDYYLELADKYPIVSIEDGMAEDDWNGWTALTERMGRRIQLVGDDLFVTNTKRMKMGLEKKASNSILIKVNQIGTFTETIKAIALAKEYGWNAVVSHRSGETEDMTISHIVVGTGAGQIKTGSASRTDRIAKYNELLRIEDNARRMGKPIPLTTSPYKR